MTKIAREQKEIVIDDTRYLITALEAMYGLNVINQLKKLEDTKETPSGSFMKDLILRSCSVDNKTLDEKAFNLHFSRNYEALFQLFGEICAFNFGVSEDPNVESDTSE